MTAMAAATVLGIVCVLLGLLAFIQEPVLGLFILNTEHAVLLLVTGLVLFAGAFTGRGSGVLKFVGIVYAILFVAALLRQVSADGYLLGMFSLSSANMALHFVIAVASLAAGFGLRRDRA